MGNLRLGAQHVAAQASTPLRPIDYYRNNYIYLPSPSYLTPEMQPMTLGDRENPTCRFCGQEEPAVSFSHQAHAIPASLGNKCLFSRLNRESYVKPQTAVTATAVWSVKLQSLTSG